MPPQNLNNVITYPSRIWDEGSNSFVPNVNNAVSSDQLTTVGVKDTNEVVGFKDGTDIHTMENAINGDLHGTISQAKPSFYQKHIQQPLAALGMDAFQPKFITDIKPTPERAFATQFAAGATADILKFDQQDKEAQANPLPFLNMNAPALTGRLAGTLVGFATLINPALKSLGLLKATAGLTPFAENIITQGVAGGVYRAISDTSNQLRDSDHPDLAKIGQGVLHDTLWWGGIGGLAGAASKPVGAAASAGLGYLMAKSDGASEPDALLNGSILAGFHLITHHGDSPGVRQFVNQKLQDTVTDYVQTKNPLIAEPVAQQTGREMVADYADQVVEKANEQILALPEPKEESQLGVGEMLLKSATDMEAWKAQQADREARFGIPGKYKDPYDPKMMNYLSQFIPPNLIVRMEGSERIRLANSPVKQLQAYADIHSEMAQESANIDNKAIDKLKDDAASARSMPRNNMDEVNSSKELSQQLVMKIGNDISSSGKESAKGTEVKQGSKKAQGVEQGKKSDVRLGDKEKNVVEAKAGTKIEPDNSKEVSTDTEPKIAKASSDINSNAVKKGFDELSPEEQASFNPITKKEQLQKVSDLLTSDSERAKRMASGEEPIPDDVHKQALFNAVKNKAIEEGDIETIRNLALSPLAKERSLAAQSLSAASFDNGPTHDPVKIIKEIQDAIGKEKAFPKETKEIVKKFKDAIKESAPKQSEWDKFISELAC